MMQARAQAALAADAENGGREMVVPAAAAASGGSDGGGVESGGTEALGVRHLILLCVHAHHRFTGPASLQAVRRAFGFPPVCMRLRYDAFEDNHSCAHLTCM